MAFIDMYVIIILTTVLLIAVINDIRFQKIPNRLTFPTMVIAVVYHSVINGFDGLVFSLEGLGVGIAVLIVFYMMGGMGAGDVKLMGAVGGFLGPKGVFVAFLCTAVIGGIYALGLLAFHGYIKEAVKRYAEVISRFIKYKTVVFMPSAKKEQKPRLCYGIAIALGALFSVFLGNLI